ncbi:MULTISPECIES: YidC/Oxa1 family membrane protein insertase [Staphylococcus]|uniref:Membrane protein insertase YidC n=1 Tax=Staphylococcus hsinchuensis TaxID=3051183 RepID=A0ABZ3EBK5_9STAP|nr:membrane protein insertase YidC [Staphylococcus sp. Marseille-Q6910]
MKKFILLISVVLILSGCDYSNEESHNDFFYRTFVAPMDATLHYISQYLNNSYGLAIILLVIIMRIIFLPFMLISVKNMYFNSEKKKRLKPELIKIDNKMKSADSFKEMIKLKKEKHKLYKLHQISYAKNAFTFISIILQLPIIIGLFFALKYPHYSENLSHTQFLWFSLKEPDFYIALLAGFFKFTQTLSSLLTESKQERQSKQFTLLLTPTIYIWWGMIFPSAIGLYWIVNSAFLTIQIYIAYIVYLKKAKREVSRSIS